MGEVLKKLVVQLSLDNKELTKGLQQTQSNFQRFASQMKTLVAGVLSYKALSGMVQAYQEFNTEIANAHDMLGGNVSDLAAMARAMKRFGGSTQSVVGALKAMNSHIQAAKFGGGALFETAKKYGLSINTSSAQAALLSLSKNLQGYSRQTKIAIMQSMGLDEAMQRAFLDGGNELERLIRRQEMIGVETEEDIKITRRFSNAVLDLKDMFSALTRELMRSLVPIIEKFVNFAFKFVESVRKNKAPIILFFIALGAVLAAVLKTLARIAIANIAAFAPFYAAAAIIAAIVLIFEDLYYYFNGWDSVTGDLCKKFPLLAKVIAPLKPLILGIVRIFNKFVDLVKNPSFEGFKDIFADLASVVEDTIQGFVNMFNELFDYLAKEIPFLAPLFDGFKAALNTIWDLIKKLFQSAKDFISALLDWNVDGMVKAVKDALNAVWEAIKSLWDTVTSTVTDLLKKIDVFGWFSDSQAPQVPSNNTNNTKNIAINNQLTQNISSTSSAGDIKAAGVAIMTDSVISQTQTLRGY